MTCGQEIMGPTILNLFILQILDLKLNLKFRVDLKYNWPFLAGNNGLINSEFAHSGKFGDSGDFGDPGKSIDSGDSGKPIDSGDPGEFDDSGESGESGCHIWCLKLWSELWPEC